MFTTRLHVSAFAAITLLFASNPVSAGLIDSRVTLQSQLGAAAIYEDFESWTSSIIDEPTLQVLDASTVVDGQGPGIVNPGLRFENLSIHRENSYLQLDRRSQYNIPSGSILGGNGGLLIDFLWPVSHAGFDFFQFSGYAASATIRVFASDDTTEIYFSPTLLDAPDAPASTFFGYSNLDGIGSIRIESTGQVWSPLVDDLTYGGVPEPATAVMLTVGALALGGSRSRLR